VAFGSVASRAGTLSSVTQVRFVLRTAADRVVHEAVLAAADLKTLSRELPR
jgi:hypothetical protein